MDKDGKNAVITTCRYDSLGRVEEIAYGNRVRTRYEYDGSGNVSFLETKAGEEIPLYFRYEYDGNGNRVAKREEQAAVDGNQRITAAYRYDIQRQLTEERDGDACSGYGYDSTGNRIWKKSCTVFEKTSPKKRAAVHLKELFDTHKEQFLETRMELYGKEEAIRHYSVDLLWGQKLYQELRFVLVEINGIQSILAGASLELESLSIIRLYSYRFRIECMFRELKQQTRAYPNLNVHFNRLKKQIR